MNFIKQNWIVISIVAGVLLFTSVGKKAVDFVKGLF